MKYIFHPDAKLELEEVILFFESCRKGIGSDFLHEVDLSINRILEYPEAWSKLSDNTRRCRLNRFPYGIIYTIRDNEILTNILGIFPIVHPGESYHPLHHPPS